MNSRLHRALCLALLLASGCGQRVSRVDGTGAVIVPSTAVVNQGKQMTFRVVPQDANVTWENPSGPFTGYVSSHGTYYAPLNLPAERTVTLQVSNGTPQAQALVSLKPGPVEATDCLGKGQGSRSDYVFFDELPEPIVRVPPSYPQLAIEAGVDGTVMLQAHVCACGEISEVRVIKSIPMLDQAAIDAVRQWYFRPALRNGEAMAVWVGIPVKFSLH
jgi:protein TonB